MSIHPFGAMLLCALFVLTCNVIDGQRLTHVQGDILVQLTELPNGEHPKTWAARQTDPSGNVLKLTYAELISAYVGIHRLTFDYRKIDERVVIAALRSRPEVLNVQFNHFTNLRETIPDDPQFPEQWQYINTGQGGGTPGADIDMDLAWDFATGGLTAAGDTIVACVIDDGIDADHPDMAPNLWVNHAEIPGNGLDDDNNGYIDDYNGWDTDSNSDNVTDGGGHGTPVAGIVGAKGNNGIGVAGVNWDVKLMIVQGGTGVESEVLQAYSYPLDMRRRYNETNGAEGAFVVSTNASWGVNFGQPEDSPLWCAFYDTLGVHGILNCGATANLALDVDVDGDLPTGCTSDYLISVTNMNRNDVKVNGAAWGLENVDLGAFGAGTWTAAAGGGYGGFGGTSGATPHVTGTIALLYSLACPGFIDLAKNDPGAAALLAKEVILLGVDPNVSLEGITVTGGRLNVANAMNLLLPSCGGCLPPLRSETVVRVDSQATLIWTSLDATAQVDLRWRAIGDTSWNLASEVNSPFLIEGLVGCTDYEYQFRADCDTTASSFTRSFQFTSEGCCRNPSNVELRLNSDTTATLIWNTVFAAQSYQVQYRRIDVPTGWATVNTADTTAGFIALEPCGTYEWRYRTLCGFDEINFSEPVIFFTDGCGPCTDLDYCPTREVSVVDEWIGFIQLGDLENESADGEDGYTDFTRIGPTAEFTIGGEYELELQPDFTGQQFPEGWAIWLDLNQDGDFEDEGERLFESPSVSSDPVEGSLTIPSTALPGFTRLRVIMQYDGVPGDPCLQGGSDFGEAEDYCVTLTPPDACTAPTVIDIDNRDNYTDTSATFNWTTLIPIDSFEVQIRLLGSEGNWRTVVTAEPTITIMDLSPCKDYEWRLRTLCGTADDNYTDPFIFLTSGCGPCIDREYCIPPTLSVVDEWIGSINIGDWENTSEAGEGGYTNFTREAALLELAPFQDYPVELTPAHAGQTFEEGWSIWIDLNQDGTFDDEGERVFSSEGTSELSTVGTFNIPAFAQLGTTRMRVYMQFNQVPGNPCFPIGNEFGEIEDYCVTITEAAPCLGPESFVQDTSVVFSDSTAFVNWPTVEGVENYLVQYRPLGSTDNFLVIGTGDTSLLVEGLDSCSLYEFFVQAVCYPGYTSNLEMSTEVQTACISNSREAILGLSEWAVVPNPSSGELVASYSFVEAPRQLMLEVIDQFGKKILLVERNELWREGGLRLNLNHLPAGMYYIRLVTDKGSSPVKKWIKW